MQTERLTIAIQKKGRLNDDSLDLLACCGIKCHVTKNSLIARAENMPIDILFVRDDDIPTMVMDGVCDLGIVGENALLEKALSQKSNGASSQYDLIMKLGFGICRLSIAVPEESHIEKIAELDNLRIATSYTYLLQQYLIEKSIKAHVLELAGSVEIAPKLAMADAICDLVSTGRTLEENNLKEIITIFNSQAVLIQSQVDLSEEKKEIIELLCRRFEGVIQAQESKYIMFHAPRSALEKIKSILPGIEMPTVLPLGGCDDQVVVHLVSAEAIFWKTLEGLKQVGASSILVLPIEKMMC